MDLLRKRRRRDFNKEKIKKVINKVFHKDLEKRHSQLEILQQRIVKIQKTLHVLRYCIVSSYYDEADKHEPASNATQIEDPVANGTPKKIHPAVKKILSNLTLDNSLHATGKLKTRRSKQNLTYSPNSSIVINTNSNSSNINDLSNVTKPDSELISRQIKQAHVEVPKETIPDSITQHSITNLDTNCSKYEENYAFSRNRNKIDYIVVIGNISKWMSAVSTNDDRLTHKWMVYVRGPKLNPSISHFVEKVVFYLHPSYKPNDVIEVKKSPFHLSRRGWGEFPLRVRIHFIHKSNKPVDIVHQLKLDKTFTGRQTLGNETIVKLHLYTSGNTIKSETAKKAQHNLSDNSTENNYCHLETDYFEEDASIVSLDHSYCSRGVSSPVNRIKQPVNDVICDVRYDNLSTAQSIIGKPILNDTNNLTVTPSLVVNNVPPLQQKRKLEEPEIAQKRRKLYDSPVYSNRFKLKFAKERYKNVLQLLPFLFKRLPIITNLAQSSIYKCAYPYVAGSLEEYSSWNIGKRLSSEWFQAKTILNIIIENQIPDWSTWTTKKMIMYARAHGYTPLANYSIFKGNSLDYLYDYIPNGAVVKNRQPIVLNEEAVDVTENNKGKPGKFTKYIQLFDLNLQKASSFIKQAVLDMGIILKPEEIMPGILFNAAERVLLQAILCMAEDIVRKARARLVHEGNFREDSSVISMGHVCDVLSSRSEFSFLLESDVG